MERPHGSVPPNASEGDLFSGALSGKIESLSGVIAKLAEALTKPKSEPREKTEPEKNLEKVENLQEGVGKFSSGMDQAGGIIKGEGGADTASGVMGQIGEAGKMLTSLGIAGGPATAAIGMFGAAVFGSIGKLQEWGEALHSSNMQFAEFSASMSNVMVGQQQRDIRYSQERGEARAGSAEVLAEGMSELRDAMAPLSDGLANLKNELVGGLSKLAAGLIRAISGRDRGEGDERGMQSVGAWMQEITSNAWEPVYNTNLNFGNNAPTPGVGGGILDG